MRILVTGGAGFLGRHLCRALVDRGDEVWSLDNYSTSTNRGLYTHERMHWLKGDVAPLHLDIKGVYSEGGKLDQIFHLACPASPKAYQKDPIKTLDTAIYGSRCVFELATHWRTRPTVLIASTSEVYGDPDHHPQRENYFGNVNTLGPRSCYDEGKRAMEAHAWAYATTRNVPIKVARIFNTYGPGMQADDGRMLPNFISSAMAGRPLEVNGNGWQTRSLCYVSDLVRGLMLLMDSTKKATLDPIEAVNLGNPDERTVLSVAQEVAALFDPHPEILHTSALRDDPKQRCPCIHRAQDLLGWSPKVGFTEGLKQTVDWFKSQHVARAA